MVQSLASAARVSDGHFVRNFVGGDRDDSDAAEGDDRQRDCVVAGEDQKCFGHGIDRFGDLGHVAAGFLDAHDVGNLGEARQGCGFEVGGGASGHVVENDGLVADGFGNGFEMAVLAFLRGLVVVGRGGEDGVDSGARGDFFGFLDCVVRGVRRGSGDDGDASGGDFDGGVDHVEPFVVGERGRLAGGAAGNEKINAGLDLPRDQIAQGCVVDGAILMKRSYECGATATELHRNRIARVRVEGNSVGSSQTIELRSMDSRGRLSPHIGSYSSRQTSLKS